MKAIASQFQPYQYSNSVFLSLGLKLKPLCAYHNCLLRGNEEKNGGTKGDHDASTVAAAAGEKAYLGTNWRLSVKKSSL